MLLIEIDGVADDVRGTGEEIEAICVESGATEVRSRNGEAERDLLWKGRKMALGAMGRLAPNYYLHDTVVPRTKLPATLRRVEEISTRLRLADRQRLSRRRRQSAPADALRSPRQRRDRARARGEQRDHHLLRRRRRRPLRRAWHRHREARVHDPGLHRRRSRGDGRSQEQLRSRRDVQSGEALSRRATCAERSARCACRRWPRSTASMPFNESEVGDRCRCESEVERSIDGVVASEIVVPDDPQETAAVSRGSGRSRARGHPGRRRHRVEPGKSSGAASTAFSRPNAWRASSITSRRISSSRSGAGARFGDVQAVLAEHGQRLPLDPPGGTDATIGGLIATGRWGPLRYSAGTLRDLLIGISVAHPSGTVSKAGGMVVKNVSGYDMPRLYLARLARSASWFRPISRCCLVPVPKRR